MDLQEELAAALAGRYEVERELGHGGMAVVFLARDVRHGRAVAIKVLPPDLATSLGTERFLREISIAARLTHPNILALHESVSGEGGRLLGYVMPFVEGETLAQRLRRERQLPIDEAVSIARQVAAALDFAHAHGVIHRDVKPDNVMLVGDQVLLADFGLARAIHSASSSPITLSGVAVGTPAYMSPEQATADRDVDGRTDIYALGCVLYEMVVGRPPFQGATAQALIAQHVTREPPSLCTERTSCPEELDAMVRKAMAKVPADRWRSAGDLSRALAEAVSLPTPSSVPALGGRASGALRQSGAVRHSGAAAALDAPPPARRRWMAIGAAVLGAAALVAGVAARRGASAAAERAPDARYAVLPFADRAAGARPTGAEVAEALADALGDWQGVTMVDARRATEVGRASVAGAGLATGEALSAARTLDATRVVLGEVGTAGDSVTARATLYDATGGATLRVQSVTWRAADGSAAAMRRLASALLRRDGAELPVAGADGRRRHSLGAWQRYDAGRAALERWDLGTATRQFREALALEPDHAPAQLWLAQALAWLDPDRPDAWRDPASRAVNALDRLQPADTLVARGVSALALGLYPQACAAYEALHRAAPRDAVGWLGLGQCRMSDPVVLRDPASPSGWRFRSSYHSAALAYDSAINRATGTPAFAFRALEHMLYTQPNRVRSGSALPPDTLEFGAYPTLAADTLALIPYTAAEIGAGALRASQSTRAAALRTNADRLATELGEWVRRDSASADARELLARVQEARGERAGDGGLAAMTTLLEARRLSADPTQRVTITVGIVRLLVKQEQFARARALADSLLAAVHEPPVPVLDALASAAALIGDADRASSLLAALAVAPGVRDPRVPDALAALQQTYLVYAALGACTDTLARMEATVDRSLQQYVSPDTREHVRLSVFTRVANLAVPCIGAQPVVRLGTLTDRLSRMQRAYAADNRAAVRAQLDTLSLLREGIRPGDVTLDRTVQEAWLLANIGDTAAAVRRLDLSLTAPATLGTALVGDPVQAAAVGRAMAFRADLAAATGDGVAARRWATNVVTLWSGASPALQPVLARMKSLAAAPAAPR